MTRAGFIGALRDGLRGLPPAAIEEIVADYETHFAEGEAAGRSESDVSAALGDPQRLARELRAEAGLKRWETEHNPSAAVGAIIALIGLGAVDILFLLPILLPAIGILIGCCVGVVVGFFAGAGLVGLGAFSTLPGAPFAQILGGFGVMALSVGCGAILGLVGIGLTNAVVWYARLHYRLLKPAMGETGGAS
jgi:uncharacterized membrane protein